MKISKNLPFLAVLVMFMVAVSSCGKDGGRDGEKKEQVQTQEKSSVSSKKVKSKVVPQKVIPKKRVSKRIVFSSGESLATKFPKSWKQRAIDLKIPLFLKVGDSTKKEYALIFPGDYILGNKVYDKHNKLVNFRKRAEVLDDKYIFEHGCSPIECCHLSYYFYE